MLNNFISMWQVKTCGLKKGWLCIAIISLIAKDYSQGCVQRIQTIHEEIFPLQLDLHSAIPENIHAPPLKGFFLFCPPPLPRGLQEIPV